MQARQVLSALALLGLASQPQGCALRLALEQWPPYVYASSQGETAGLDWELARAIVKQAGCTLKPLAELPAPKWAGMACTTHACSRYWKPQASSAPSTTSNRACACWLPAALI
jgi:hypothetical protein